MKHRGNSIKDYHLLSIKSKIFKCTLKNQVRVSDMAEISNSYVDEMSSVGRYSKIVHTNIGKYCAISWNTTINALSHPYSHMSISAFPYVPYVGNFVKERTQLYDVVCIKNDVWIGANSVIMPGVTIGNGAVIGASSVVTKDVPDYAIVAGVPAKIIKYRFSKDVIDKLLEVKWWDIDRNIIKKNISLWQKKLTIEDLRHLEKELND